ncbi:VOC family protein [Nodosilinea nodulosa]|uniref:VOC family protein n=1 Tax=Nodosilinea nodulosa TaxID=416001 RepID=UPI0002FA1063|nr:VOC family protein [Nodosilinea nodulosa]
MAITQGAHHIGLTVPDLNAARDFFVDVLEFKQVAEKPDYPACFVSDGTTLITLWQAVDPANATAFDRKSNLGLHHFALKVDGLETLNALHQKLATTEGVQIEFAPESLGGGTTHHMMFYIPGGIRMELIALGG